MGKETLSKSSYIKGLQCEKYLYLYKHHYDWQDPVSKKQQAIFNRGHEVGILAQKLFPGGEDANPFKAWEYSKALQRTRELIEEGVKVIYEAAFIYDDVVVIADIIVRHPSGWKIYEVKSTTSISETILYDAGIQYFVISNSGIAIDDFSIVYINNNYLRGIELDINQLFNIQSVAEEAKEQHEFVHENIRKFKKVLRKSAIPSVEIGMQCENPYRCSFIGYCWKHIPENSVFEVSGMYKTKKFDLYKNGIKLISDLENSTALNDAQSIQVNNFLTGEKLFDREKIDEFVSSLNYPLYFLDFETFMPAIPRYFNSKPYQQVPFQYSLHYRKSPGSPIQHREYLADSESDPRIAFIESLINLLNEDGDIVVYNQGFEKMILRQVGAQFPEYSDPINKIILRIKDLMTPFQKKWYYVPEMKGRYSIKAVLPAIIPELNYGSLEISDGQLASVEFERLLDETDHDEIQKIRSSLLKYCEMDTFAMVRILEHFEDCLSSGNIN